MLLVRECVAGQPIEEALRKKFGPQAEAILQRVATSGRADGATFANWKWRANTVKGALLRCQSSSPASLACTLFP